MPEISTHEAKDTQVLQFPWKLHSILNSPELSSVVTWMPNGESFRILSKDRFANEVMPVFFSSTSYKSFQRSLNLWGFRIYLKGPQRGECFHPFFQRGKPGLCECMTRVKLRGKYSKPKKQIEGITITTIKKAMVGKSLPLTSSMASDSESPKEGRNECRVMVKRLMTTPTLVQPVVPSTPSVPSISPLATTLSPPYYYGINFDGSNNGNSNSNGCIGLNRINYTNYNNHNNNHNHHHNDIGPFLLQAAAETILQQQREKEIRCHLIQIMTTTTTAHSPLPYSMNHPHPHPMMNQVVRSALNHGTDHQKLLLPRTQFF